MHLKEIGWEGADWIQLAQDREQWQAVVNTLIDLRVQLKAEKFLTSWRLLISKGLCSMELVTKQPQIPWRLVKVKRKFTVKITGKLTPAWRVEYNLIPLCLARRYLSNLQIRNVVAG
jgi:hypothetical protein